MPDIMVSHEGDADHIVVDTARRFHSAGELFVFWDGDGLVVKRVEPVHGPGPARVQLLSVIGRVVGAEHVRAVRM